MSKQIIKKTNQSRFLRGFIGGLGWSIGATLGFAIFVAVISMAFNLLGGLPYIGNILADIVIFTNEALRSKVTVIR